MFQKIFTPAILAGICISIGCVVNLRVGGVAGAVLFAFGLTTVVYYGLKLYTGTAGFIRRQGDWSMLFTVLFGNIVGCLLTAWLIAYAQPDCVEPAAKILAGRLDKGPWACFLLAIGCGFIMTTAVEFARKDAAFGAGCSCVHSLRLCSLHCRRLLFPRFSFQSGAATSSPHRLSQRGLGKFCWM